MKKFLSVCLVAVLLVILLPMQAQAAASASFTGPGTVRAGDTITLSFKAGGGIYGGNGSVSFDSNQLTLQSYSGKLGSPWAVEFAGNNFVFYDNSMASPISGTKTIFTATFKVNASVKPGTEIVVSCTGVTLSDGNADSGIGTRSYKVTVAPPLSGNANLASLTVSNANITPAFAAGTTSYKASVPFSTSSLQISAKAEHAGAKVEVVNNKLKANGNTNVKVVVTAENGAVKEYVIKTFRARDPNYVESNVNTLNSLSVEGYPISPAFSADRTDYAIYVPYETETVMLGAEATDDKSKVSIPEITGIPMGETTYTIPVTAENGDVRNYTVTVFRAEPFDDSIVVPVPTEPETTPPETTEAPTEAPTEEPTEAPTEPSDGQAAPAHPIGMESWLWIVMAVLCFAAGSMTVILINMLRKK